ACAPKERLAADDDRGDEEERVEVAEAVERRRQTAHACLPLPGRPRREQRRCEHEQCDCELKARPLRPPQLGPGYGAYDADERELERLARQQDERRSDDCEPPDREDRPEAGRPQSPAGRCDVGELAAHASALSMRSRPSRIAPTWCRHVYRSRTRRRAFLPSTCRWAGCSARKRMPASSSASLPGRVRIASAPSCMSSCGSAAASRPGSKTVAIWSSREATIGRSIAMYSKSFVGDPKNGVPSTFGT